MAKRKEKRKGKAPLREPVAPVPASGHWLTNRRRMSWLIFGLALLLYANTLFHDYALDDAIVLYDNMFTNQGVEGIPGILQYDTFYGFFKEEGKARLVAGGRYRPLSLVFFALEVELFGQQPFVGHLFNILFYALTAMLLYWLLLDLLGQGKEPVRSGYFVALGAALLFVAHPLHTEVVANIKGRDEIFSLLGSVAALYFSLRAYHEKKGWLNALAGLLFFLALLSKENAITFLAIVPLTYFFFTNAKTGRTGLATLPFLAAAAIFLIIRFSILGWGLGAPSAELMNNPFLKLENGQYVPFTTGERLATVFHTLGRYLQLLVFPHPLTHDYYPRHIGLMRWGNVSVLLSLGAHLAMLAYALWRLPKKDPVSFGILFYLLTLSIVSNLVFPVGTNMAERLLFMPSTGFCLVAALLLLRLAARDGEIRTTEQLRPAIWVAGAIVLLFSVRTVIRNPVWKNNYTLFTTDVKVAPNSAKLRNAVGGELTTRAVEEKNEARRQAMLEEAVGHLREAVRIHPSYKNAWLLLGNANNYLQRYDESIEAYQRALALDANYTDALNNLGITYRDAGRYYGEQKGDLARAISYLEQAYQLRPQEYETVRLLGVAYGISGNTQKAIEFFTKGVELKPNDADAWFNLGNAYYNVQDTERGREMHQKALELDPDVGRRRERGEG